MAMRRRAYDGAKGRVGEKETFILAENTRIGETPMTFTLESTNLRGGVIQKLLTILGNAFYS